MDQRPAPSSTTSTRGRPGMHLLRRILHPSPMWRILAAPGANARPASLRGRRCSTNSDDCASRVCGACALPPCSASRSRTWAAIPTHERLSWTGRAFGGAAPDSAPNADDKARQFALTPMLTPTPVNVGELPDTLDRHNGRLSGCSCTSLNVPERTAAGSKTAGCRCDSCPTCL
jgi:hypothetical protein